jgi:hypothetical protein
LEKYKTLLTEQYYRIEKRKIAYESEEAIILTLSREIIPYFIPSALRDFLLLNSLSHILCIELVPLSIFGPELHGLPECFHTEWKAP